MNIKKRTVLQKKTSEVQYLKVFPINILIPECLSWNESLFSITEDGITRTEGIVDYLPLEELIQEVLLQLPLFVQSGIPALPVIVRHISQLVSLGKGWECNLNVEISVFNHIRSILENARILYRPSHTLVLLGMTKDLAILREVKNE